MLKVNCLTGFKLAFLVSNMTAVLWAADKVEVVRNPQKPEAVKSRQAAVSGQQKVGKESGSQQGEKVTVKSFRDCADCPEMIKIPAGSFTMGSAAGEEGSEEDERRRHEVNVGGFSLGKYEVTRAQFSVFVNESKYDGGSSCYIYEEGNGVQKAGNSWHNPGFSQAGNHPVACVSYEDAQAYANWLSQKTGKKYRLPTEAEWEYAARAGTTTARYWGDDVNETCRYANVSDQTAKQSFADWTTHNCSDGAVFTAPVGSFQPNGFGLHDMLGNVWEWTCSTYGGGSYDGSETTCDKSPDTTRVNRGGSWSSRPLFVRAANRIRLNQKSRISELGFRVAQD